MCVCVAKVPWTILWKYVTNNVQKYRPQNTAKEQFQKLQFPDGRNCTKINTTTSCKDQTASLIPRLRDHVGQETIGRGAVKSSVVFESLSIRIFPMYLSFRRSLVFYWLFKQTAKML